MNANDATKLSPWTPSAKARITDAIPTRVQAFTVVKTKFGIQAENKCVHKI
jgi:hypothetical protein